MDGTLHPISFFNLQHRDDSFITISDKKFTSRSFSWWSNFIFITRSWSMTQTRPILTNYLPWQIEFKNWREKPLSRRIWFKYQAWSGTIFFPVFSIIRFFSKIIFTWCQFCGCYWNGPWSHLGPWLFRSQRNLAPKNVGPCMKMPYNDIIKVF